MKPYHVAAVFTICVALWFLGDACAHAIAAPTEPKLTAWTLSGEAKDDEMFCVEIPKEPQYPPDAIGLHCARVGDVRIWFGHLKYAH